MELGDDVGLLHKDRVNERHNFVLKQLPFLTEHALENSRVVDA
jgi:hypothetical protein